jgi:hypothetical protein
MTISRPFGAAASAAALALLLAGCGDDGPGGVVAPAALPRLTAIAVEPGLEIWNDATGDPPAPPAVTAAFNAAVIFTCAGPIAAGAPGNGGAPLLVGLVSGLAPAGAFAVEDDPALPAGNRRRLVFRPAFDPGQPSTACSSGYLQGETYSVVVPAGRFGVAGEPLENAAATSFGVPTCGAGGAGFLDPVAGAPIIVSTSPATSTGPTPPVGGGTVVAVEFNEALDPAFLPAGPLGLRDVVSGAAVPGSSTVQTLGAGIAARSQFVFTATSALPAGRTFELVIATGLRDFAGNAFAPGSPLRFSTSAGAGVAQSIGETFDTTNQSGATSPGVAWTGDGAVRFGDLFEFAGDGADGALVVAPGQTLVLDTNETIVVGGTPQSRRGVWSFTSLTVGAAATVRLVGPYPAQLRVAGVAQIDGTLKADAGVLNPATNPGAPAYELGPRNGGNNNGGVPGPATIAGGAANAGGGGGGTASAADQNPSPTNYCPTVSTLHTYFGTAGAGPSVDGAPNTDPQHPQFAGGAGGRSGFFPQSFAGEQGGYGGAGGSAATAGAPGTPRIATACAPASIPICPTTSPGGNGLPLGLAQPSVVSAHFIPPITVPTAGSGGGGGGDKLETGVPPANDEQGGGGGGGGGAIRLTVIGAAAFGPSASLTANGAVGATGATLAGHGGSGSGGQIWIQSFGALTIPTTAAFSVLGPARFGGTTTPGCSLQAAGGGGQGLVQIESVGVVAAPTNVSAGAVVQSTPLPFGPGFSGLEALSAFYDSGKFAPDWTGAVESFAVGPLVGSTLTIRYEGAHQAVDGSGPDLATLRTTVDGQPGGAPITAAGLDALDGYRYVRFRVMADVPQSLGAAATDLPQVFGVTLNFTAP